MIGTMRTFFIISISSCFCSQMFAQAEFSKWYFGHWAALDFSTSPPTVLNNNVLNTAGSSASIADNAGNLLFYTDGVQVVNKNHTLMANGSGLNGGSGSSQSAIIVKQPGNNNLYYIFTTPNFGNQPTCYSIVDMNLAAGFGSVTVKNYTIYTPSSEKQIAIRHCNGVDVWIVSHESNSTNNFRAYLLSATGLNSTPVISPIGESLISLGGQMKISPDGKKLASATKSASQPPPGTNCFFLFDFDASSGVLSNSLALLSYSNAVGTAYGIEFSPDGTKLFGTTITGSNPAISHLYQWDVCASSTAAIMNSKYTYSLATGNTGFMGMQRANDGKIYVSMVSSQSLSVINNPNVSGSGMNFQLFAQNIGTAICGTELPNYINPYLRPTPLPFTNTVACQNAKFAVTLPTFSSGCSTVPYAPTAYLWNFGDPNSGADNTSTLSSPAHLYSSIGTFTATLILFNPCSNDTLTRLITVSALGPTVNVAGPTTICKGDRYTYTVSGGNSYQWSSGGSASTTALSPVQNTVYTASATLNGCSLSKSFSITVNPCLGMSAYERRGTFEIFPNPASQNLNVSLQEVGGEIQILDCIGRVCKISKIESPAINIPIGDLPEGSYFAVLKKTGFVSEWNRFVVAR
jgi:PKD repeat protein